jgi:hypothetical protein
MDVELSDEQWKPIDEHILQNRIINGIKAIKEATGAGLREAGDIFHDRYDMLRASRSGDFVCDHDEYWNGFYS